VLLVLLGRVHLAWPVVGRFRAWRLFEEAARRAPHDPEPRYQQIQVGLYLRGDDGERLARDAIFKILEIVPDYRDIWTIWRGFYEGDGHRRRALRLLERYNDVDTGRRRAGLLLELEEYETADSLLASLLSDSPSDVRLWALRAQAAFEAGRDDDGQQDYSRAVALAASDSTDFLWHQIAAIASPGEEAEYHVTPPEGRRRFLEAFWARREPDLTTPQNERLAEHFHRLRVARHDYRVLHPQSYFHYSPEWRALQGGQAAVILDRLGGFTLHSDVVPGRSVLEDELERLGIGVDVRDVPEPDSVSRYARLGLDGRGLIYLRFGDPNQRLITVGPGPDVEAWRYVVDGRMVSLVFARATAWGGPGFAPGGDFVLFPTSRRELHNGVVMLERDATSVVADLSLTSWVGFFRADDPDGARQGLEDVVVRTSAERATIAVWTLGYRELARVSGEGPLVIHLREGAYRFGADARVGERLGRLRGPLDVPPLAPGWLAVSSLLAAVTSDTAPDRMTMARRMPADRRFALSGRPLTLYAEVYDLPDRDGMADYQVDYTFAPVTAGSGVTFSFTRVVPSATRVIERLVVQPGEVPAGRYRVTLTVKDRVLGLRARSVILDLTLH
jgi:tetratricopeptide (TPR) repeat protein